MFYDFAGQRQWKNPGVLPCVNLKAPHKVKEHSKAVLMPWWHHYRPDKVQRTAMIWEGVRGFLTRGQLGGQISHLSSVTSAGCICWRASSLVSHSPPATSASVSRPVTHPRLTTLHLQPTRTHTHTIHPSHLSEDEWWWVTTGESRG